VQRPAAVLRSATTVAARLLRREGEIGVIAPAARADVVLTDENPLDGLAALAEPDRGVSVVVKDGQVVKDHRT
jgi:imidazolonepropionase-like amidohydrolase